MFTGCVYEHDDMFHIFYTGHNPHFRKADRPEQAVMHATSCDLTHWEKDSANPILFADPAHYEAHDWRDPFVFWNEAAQEHWMLLAARARRGPENRRGITALCTSKDLKNWTIADPFWQPGLYFTHECPDVFRMGEFWYSVYSTFSERMLTHYRMSPSLSGPWVAPTNDSFDGRAFYAAKTASDGARRFAFGWVPSRTNEDDTGTWNWGGNLVVHEIQQQPDGALTVHPPWEIVAYFAAELPLAPQPELGAWMQRDGALVATAQDSFAWCRMGTLPDSTGDACMIEAEVQFEAGMRSVGVALRADANLDCGYLLRLEPERQRVSLERFPRPGDEPAIIERPVALDAARPVRLRVLIEGSVMVAYIDDVVALSARMYGHKSGDFGLFVAEGAAAFTNVRLRAA